MNVGIVGATGYVGSELVRWVLGHPALTLAAVTSQSRAGERLADVCPNLAGFCSLTLTAFDPAALSRLDVVLVATPHGTARPLIEQLSSDPIIVDLSADHRHAPGWVYGLPEWAAEALPGARRIAAPGCFATALSLSLAPLVAAGVIDGPVSVVAATGSTGSGAVPKGATHHPERFVNLKAYKVLRHQHVPEVTATLAGLGAAPALRFVPWSAPVDRGIFATALLSLTETVSAAAIFADAYAAAPLVRLRQGSPELRAVRGSPLADIAIHQDGTTVAVLCAIDNLGRGAAAQAIAALNLALGLPVTAGLTFIPPTP